MTELKRTLGLPVLLFYGLGNILGAGIYVLIGKVAGAAGMFTPLAFLVAAAVASFSAFSYSELSARYPLSAGEAVYVQEGFQMLWLSRLTGLLIAAAGLVAASTIFRGFYGYFYQFFQLPEPLVIIVVVLLMGLLMVWGIKQSAGVAMLLTLLEICGLLLVIWAGKDLVINWQGGWQPLLPPAETTAWTGILLGAFLAFFAFLGFEDMVNVAEEVKNPQRTLPAAILLALVVSTVLYILVALVAVLALDQQTLAASKAPLVDVLAAASDIDPQIISVIGMFAVVNGALIMMIMSSRVLYGMANKGWIWPVLARVSTKTRTPVVASWLVILSILILALWFPLEALAKATSYLILVVFSLCHAALALIKLRQTAPPAGIIEIPLWVPVIGCAASLSLLLYQLFVG